MARSRVLIVLLLFVIVASACARSSSGAASTSPLTQTSSPPPPPSPSDGPAVTINLSVPSPGDVVAAFGSVWVQSGTDLWKVSPDGSVLDRFSDVSKGPGIGYMGWGGGGYRTLAAGYGSVWSLVKGAVLRLDPADGRVLDSIPVPEGLASIAAGEGAVWVACCDSGPALLLRIDPQTDEVSHIDVGVSVASLAVGAGFVWVLGIGEAPYLVQVDPSTMRVVGTVATNARGSVAVGADTIWVMDHGSGLDRIDASSGRIDHTYEVPGTMMGLSAFGDDALVNAGDLLWVSGCSGDVQTLANLAKPDVANAGIAVDGTGDHPVVWLTEPSDQTLVAVQL
ncbi:MAG: hypothetical protein ABI869_05930 [Actinomycetota bacterium]